MASLTDDTKELKLLADGNLDKRNIWLIGVGHTRALENSVCRKYKFLFVGAKQTNDMEIEY